MSTLTTPSHSWSDIEPGTRVRVTLRRGLPGAGSRLTGTFVEASADPNGFRVIVDGEILTVPGFFVDVFEAGEAF